MRNLSSQGVVRPHVSPGKSRSGRSHLLKNCVSTAYDKNKEIAEQTNVAQITFLSMAKTWTRRGK